MASSPITSWQIDEETMEAVTDFIFFGSRIASGGDCSHEMKKKIIQENLLKLNNSNIKNFRYADDTTLTAEREQELNSLLIKVKEESEKAGLKLNIQKSKIMASSPITSWQIDEEIMETMRDFIFGDSKITADGD